MGTVGCYCNMKYCGGKKEKKQKQQQVQKQCYFAIAPLATAMGQQEGEGISQIGGTIRNKAET